MDHIEQAILFDAIAVAGLARTGSEVRKPGRVDSMGLTLDRVDNLRVRAEEQLPRGHDLRRVIFTFATMYEELRYDAYAVVKLGESLEADCGTILNPRSAPRQRADLDG